MAFGTKETAMMVKWTFTPDPKGRLTSCPLVHKDTAYIGCDNGALQALDAATGEVLWTFKTGDRIWLDA